jgi:hypothetical protein
VIPYPGAPPTPPYDNAGWTLAFQMGVQFDRMLDPFSGPFEKITEWNVKPPAGTVTTSPPGDGYVFSREVNDAVIGVNRLLASGDDVFAQSENERPVFFIGAKPGTVARLQTVAKDLGISARPAKLSNGASKLRAPRIGLWDQYGGSMESGWTRWILEQFEFKFDRVYPPQLDNGTLNAKYDVLIFVNGAIPGSGGGGRAGRGPSTLREPQGRPEQGRGATGSGQGGRGAGADAQTDLPAEYRPQVGSITAARTMPQLKAFVEAGGTIIALSDSAMNLAGHLGLPIENHLTENGQPLPRAKFFVPGSVLTAKIDTRHPIAAGMRERTDVFFDNSPVFKLRPGAAEAGLRIIAMFDTAASLHSGWAWGQTYLEGGVLAIDAAVGKGHVLLFGPEILQRAQPHGTFKLLFNGIYSSVTR